MSSKKNVFVAATLKSSFLMNEKKIISKPTKKEPLLLQNDKYSRIPAKYERFTWSIWIDYHKNQLNREK